MLGNRSAAAMVMPWMRAWPSCLATSMDDNGGEENACRCEETTLTLSNMRPTARRVISTTQEPDFSPDAYKTERLVFLLWICLPFVDWLRNSR